MKSTVLILIFVFSVFSIFAQELYSIGEKHTIASKNLAEKRILNIHLPLNFSKDSTYPVMYVLNGSAHEDFLQIAILSTSIWCTRNDISWNRKCKQKMRFYVPSKRQKLYR